VGIIANPEKKLQIVILSINGKEVLLRQKERKEGVLVKKISRDKVSIEYKGRQADIEKNE
jgi:type II secretory pathway component PulC